jgi:S-DNA-T family DNA segregation ATPase FtsK/SpoIIIE
MTQIDDRPPNNGHKLAPQKDAITAIRGERPKLEIDTTAPVLPAHLRNREAATDAAKAWWRNASYTAKKRAVQAPMILFWLVIYSPRGFGRLVAMLGRWVYDQDSAALRHEHAGNRETAEYARAHAVRKANLHARGLVFVTGLTLVAGPILAWTAPYVLSTIVAVALFLWTVKLIPGKEAVEYVVALVIAGVVWFFLPYGLALIPVPPTWAFVVVIAAVVLTLGYLGRNREKKLGAAQKFDTPSQQVKPSADLVIDALIASVTGITEKHRELFRVHAPGVARARGGYHLSLELPPGITVSDVMEKREEFAAALRRQLGCVWPSKGHMHPGHMKLFIGDEPMATAQQARWRLADGKRVDVFNPLPLFTNQEGDWVDLLLMYKALVIGGAPGFGKSFGLRALGCAVALDPRTRIVVLDGKANGDMRPFRLVAHGYYEDDDDEGIAAQVKAVQEIREEMRRRAKFLRELPAEENPEDKVTSALVDKYPHLAPIFVLIDECQVYTEHEDKAGVREPFISAAADLVRRGRSAGIVPVFCTQKPSADVLPTAITDNCSCRICHKVNGQRANDAVLGNEMHSSGIKATKFGPDDKGLAWLKGDGAEPLVVRTVYGLDKPASESLLAKARALREGLGLLTGYAAGDEAEEEEQQVNLLEDAREVLDSPENNGKAMSLAGLRDRLELLRPGIWGHLDVDALGSMLRAAGVTPASVYCADVKRSAQGVKREWLNIAATDDEGPEDDGPGLSVVR